MGIVQCSWQFRALKIFNRRMSQSHLCVIMKRRSCIMCTDWKDRNIRLLYLSFSFHKTKNHVGGIFVIGGNMAGIRTTSTGFSLGLSVLNETSEAYSAVRSNDKMILGRIMSHKTTGDRITTEHSIQSNKKEKTIFKWNPANLCSRNRESFLKDK